ncbi:MAG: choice-of-anchor J domain-containing protein [Bizionia sp.]|nr:choice-of-anchor J domain-containing protein [Bizionia sp.]
MKKITFSLLLLICCIWQSNAQIFIEENLDSGFPVGWTQNSYFTSTTATYLCEGTGNLADNMYSSSANDGSLTSPNYPGISNGTDTTVEFQWLARPYSSNAVDYSVYVEYSTDDAATWNLLSSFAVTETTPCTTYLEVIPAIDLPTGSDFKFRIRNEWQSGDSYFYLDDIAISQVIACPQPSDLLASNESTTTADLQWVENGSASIWNVKFDTIGFDPITEGTDVAGVSNPYTLTGLMPSSTYDFYVQADCGSGELSAWVGPFSFTTLCDAVTTFPMLESFEGITTGQPNCWEVQGTTTNASYDWTSYEFGYSGRGMRFDSYVNSSGNTSELISPTYDLAVLPTAEFSFWYKNPTGGNFDVLISTDNGATYTALETGLTGQVDWIKKTYDITSSIASTVKIKFFGTSNYGSGDARIYLDEVQIREVPSCVEPANVSGANIGIDAADLSWSAGASETEWEYALQLATDPAPTTGTSTTVTAYAASGLSENTDYVFYVRSVCGTEYSVFVAYAFTTAISGAVCEAAIEVTALPYTTTDNTANYGDNYSGSPGASGCGTTANYLNGDDVVYAYTAAADGTINIALSAIGSTYSGMFVYTDCADIGTACAAGFGNGGSAADYDFDVAVTAGTTYYVVISTWATPQSTTYTLDITEVLCADPTALGVTNVTDVSVDLSWTNGTESSWNIEYGSAGFAQGTAGTVLPGVTTNPYALTGLTASTSYDFYVQAICDSGDLSAWVGPFNFSTACDPTPSDVPFLEDFEATNCGSVINEGTGNQWMPSTVMGAGFTTAHMRYSYDFANPADSWYFTQAINLVAGQEYYISYDFGNSGTYDEKMKVAYGTANTSAAMTTVLADYPTVTGGALQSDTVTFTAATTGVYYFGFHAYSDANMNQLRLDNVIVDQTLSTQSFKNDNLFTYYPNPVENTLSLKGIKNIQNVAVVNMLGQEVLRAAPNAVTTEIDMSNLQAGAYFVKVTVENATKTIKIIKE